MIIYNMVKARAVSGKIYKNTVQLHKVCVKECEKEGQLYYKVVLKSGREGGLINPADVKNNTPLGSNQLVYGYTMEELVKYARDNWGM
jgi:hypothetical protein